MLTQLELDDLRDEFTVQVMPDTCHVLSRVLSVDTMGAPVETWGTASYNVPCRLDHATGSEQISGGAIQPYYHYMLTLPWGTSISSLNRVKHDSIIYSVKSVSSGTYVACLRCELEKIG